MKLIFERSRPGRGNGLLPSLDVPAAPLPEKYRRKTAPRLPELGESDLSRHYQALARRAPGGQILDCCIKQQRGLCHAQLLPPLAFSQGIVIEYSRDGLAFDSVLLPELREIEENAAPVVGDHLLEAEGHQTGSAAPN